MRLVRGLRLLPELLRTIRALPSIEWGRRTEGPEPLLSRLRQRARRSRNTAQRERLWRAIRFVDARMPGGPNCYRRVLLETALDAGAAKEKIVFGLRAGGTLRSGHAWFSSRRDGDERYDVEIAL